MGEKALAGEGEDTEEVRAQLLAALTHETLAEVAPNRPGASRRQDLLSDSAATSERLLRLLVAHSAEMLVVITKTGTVLFASPSVERTLGHDPRDLVGREVFEFIDPEALPDLAAIFEQEITQAPPVEPVLATVFNREGHKRSVEALLVELLDEPAVSGFVVTLRDVTDRVRAEEQAEIERARFVGLVDSMPDVVVRLDLGLRPTYGNAAALQLESGWLAAGTGSPRLFAEQAAPSGRARRELEAVLRTGEGRTFETAVCSRNGDIWLSSTAVPERDQSGEVTGILLVTRDVTVYRARTEELTRRALEDPLTGLANRSRLEAELERALHGMTDTAGPVGILFADLDGFKEVNDTHGHAVGDKLLKTFARRAREALRPSDLVARFGGDEFVVLPNRLHITAELESLADRLHTTVQDPFEIDGLELTISLSIGIAVTNRSQPLTAEEMLGRADQAMYASKRDGRARTTAWTSSLAPKNTAFSS